MSSDVTVNKTASRRGVGNKVLWVVQVVLGIDFIIGGMIKLLGLPSMVDLFDRIGAGQGFRYFIGAVELAGGIGLLIAPIAGLAAMGLVALMTGALYTNVVIVGDPPWAPLTFLVVAAVVAWRRWPRTKALFGSRLTRTRRG